MEDTRFRTAFSMLLLGLNPALARGYRKPPEGD